MPSKSSSVLPTFLPCNTAPTQIKSLNILGHTVKVQFTSRVDVEDSMGEWDPDSMTIKIRKGIPDHMRWSTLIHEVTHAVLYFSGWSETLAEKGEKLEESLVLMIEHLLIPVLRDLHNDS